MIELMSVELFLLLLLGFFPSCNKLIKKQRYTFSVYS